MKLRSKQDCCYSLHVYYGSSSLLFKTTILSLQSLLIQSKNLKPYFIFLKTAGINIENYTYINFYQCSEGCIHLQLVFLQSQYSFCRPVHLTAHILCNTICSYCRLVNAAERCLCLHSKHLNEQHSDKLYDSEISLYCYNRGKHERNVVPVSSLTQGANILFIGLSLVCSYIPQ